jgi:ribulose-phosphate 3-epimerase
MTLKKIKNGNIGGERVAEKVKLSASILNVRKLELHSKIAELKDVIDYIHIDVMDGIFVPNKTPGIDMFKNAKRFETKPLDVHLMVEEPERELSNYDGASIITFHIETVLDTKTMTVNMQKFNEISSEIRELGAKVGISIKPNTTVNLLRNIIRKVDLILVMTVEPGYGGQKLIPSTLDKIENIRKMGFKGIVEVDGGITTENVSEVKKRGATLIVAGTGLFEADNPVEAGKEIKR